MTPAIRQLLNLMDFQAPELPGVMDIFNNLELGIMLLDYGKKKVLYANRHLETLTRELYTDLVEQIYKTVEVGKKSIYRELKIGADLNVGYSVYPVTENEYLILVSDITNKKIFQKNREENKYYNKMDNFVAEIAHEIGNPLTSVIMTLQVLFKNIATWSNEEKGEYITQSINELKRLSAFLRKIRDLSREDDIEKKTVRLKTVVDRLRSQNRALLEAKNVTFQNRVAGDVEVSVDEDAFYRVLFNLLQNTLDCLPQDKSDGKIEVSIERVDDSFVRLLYQNNGPPIPLHIQEKIFMPFFTTKEEGRGMGLNISRKLMVRMGGTIKIGAPGKEWGGRFLLYVPRQQGLPGEQS